MICESTVIGFNNPGREEWKFDSEEDATSHFNQTSDSFRHDNYHEVNADHVNFASLFSTQPKTKLNESEVAFLSRVLDEYMPVGIPRLQELNNARKLLSEIEALIKSRPADDRNRAVDKSDDLYAKIIEKSSRFYEMIPHIGNGYSKDIRKGPRPPIETTALCQSKKQTINQIQSVLQAIQTQNSQPLKYFCEDFLNVELTPIRKTDYKHEVIELFKFEKGNDVRFKNVFKVQKAAWNERFKSGIGNEHYLFHVTHLHSMIGILRGGLKILPTYAHSINKWLGRGVYFFGHSEGAFNFAKGRRIILICRVALGNSKVLEKFIYNDDLNRVYKLEEGENSLKAEGSVYRSKFAFDKRYRANLPDELKQVAKPESVFSNFDRYDEFLVQDENQVKIEYIIELH